MNRLKARELLPIITAFAEGKTIEINHVRNGWEDIRDPDFGAESQLYRIKPKPREWWVTIEGAAMHIWMVRPANIKGETVKVIEVLE